MQTSQFVRLVVLICGVGTAVGVARRGGAEDATELPAIDGLPVGVDWAAVAVVVPSWVDREGLVDLAGDSLSGATLAGAMTVLRVQYGAVEHSLLLVGADGAVLDTRHMTQRGRTLVGDLDGDGRNEVVLDTIEGNALSIYPRTRTVLRINEARRFEEVLSVPLSLSFSEGRQERVCMANRIDFGDGGRIEVVNERFEPECVEAVLMGDSPWPAGTPGWPSKPGQAWTLNDGEGSGAP
jgi:hypothetical protein